MRATMKMGAVFAGLWSAVAAAQTLDLKGYYGFVREETESVFHDSSFLQLPRGSRETRAHAFTFESAHFQVADGEANGTYRREERSDQLTRLSETGLCLTSGARSHLDHLIRQSEDAVANVSGPGECVAFLDESGGGLDCWSNAEFTLARERHNDSIVTSDCADYTAGSESDHSLDESENAGFGAAHAFEDRRPGPRPAVLARTETFLELDGRRTTRSFFLSRDDARYELLLVPPDGYDAWRPKAGASETERGNTLVIRATLRRTDGKPLDTTARRITFRLEFRSHEPGTMINHPPAAQRVSPTPADLAFEADLNAPYDLEVSEDGALAVTVEGSYETVYAQISSFDWGAYGALTVEAELHNGDRAAGRVEGASGADARVLLIPQRAAFDDPIPTGWRAQGPGRDGDPLSDEDPLPTGDGHSGDGLSLYDEYRGFLVNGARLEGDPERKELFIHNTFGTAAAAGIAQFAREAGLLVHGQLRAAELSADRVINFNTSGRFSTPQHGLRISPAPPGQSYAAARGGPGTPAQIRAVYLPLEVVLSVPASYLSATLAHELGHSVNIYHHGGGDPGDRAFQVVDGVVYERRGDQPLSASGQAEVTLFEEDGTPFPLELISPSAVTRIGVRQGQHSGVESCLMRYDTARWHVRAIPSERYRNQTPEVVGSTFCSATSGTGVNASDRLPAPRYGGAADQLGNCKAQLCVNDRHRHPRPPGIVID